MQPYFDQTRKTTSKKNGRRPRIIFLNGRHPLKNGRRPQKKWKATSKKYGRQPKFLFKGKTTSKKYGRRPQFFLMEDNLKKMEDGLKKRN
jgi:hypothetical protein